MEAIPMAVPRDFYNFFDICKMEGIPEGTAKSAIDRGIEGISGMEAIKEIGHLFKQFEKPVRGKMLKQYGIRRNHYDYWKKHGHAPVIAPGRPPKWDDATQIRIHLRKDVYDEFKAIVDKANSVSAVKVSYRDMHSVAVQEFNARRRHILGGDL